MNVTELRLGNLVCIEDCPQRICVVSGIADKKISLIFAGANVKTNVRPEQVQGIPITGELLEKLGFSYLYSLWRKTERGRSMVVGIERTFVSIEAFEDRLNDSRCTCHGIKYLHQLQNLFFSIAKHELEMNI